MMMSAARISCVVRHFAGTGRILLATLIGKGTVIKSKPQYS